MIFLIVANLMGQQYLVSICLTDGASLITCSDNDLQTSLVDSCQSMCHTVVFMSNFLVC